MTELLFSLNATIPVFLLILLGFIICKIGIINDDFIKIANKFNFTITLPALLFRDLSSTDFTQNMDIKYILFCAITTSVCFWGIWFLARLFIKDKSIIGAFVQASFRGSAAILGIAFIQNIYGNSSIAPLMIIGTVPLYNIYSVIVLTIESNNGSKKSIKDTAINVLKNPIIISIFVGLIFSALSVDFPTIVDKTLGNIASMASPLALICIGGAFKGLSTISSIKPTLIATSIKLIILPMLFLPIAVHFGYTDEKLVALIVMLASPTTPSCYIMAQTMGNDEKLTASIVVVATLLSSITLTLLVYILKSLTLI